MKFSIASSVLTEFPNLCIGVVAAKNLNNRGEDPEIASLLASALDSLSERVNGKEYKQHPHIAVWREAFQQVNCNPNKFQGSIEALVSRVVKGGRPPSINKIVDLNNALSLKYLLPMGAHDLDRIQGDLEVRFSRPGDIFTPFGEENAESVGEGEIVYADGLEVRTRRWIWRQGDHAKITADSETVFFPIDGFSGVTSDAVLQAREELASILTNRLGAEVEQHWLDASHQSAVLFAG